MMKRNIVVAISGASGSIYAKLLIDKLSQKNDLDYSLIFSGNATQIWKDELGGITKNSYKHSLYKNNDFNASFASGSSNFDTMIIIPASMGIIGRIASGISNDLITRAADVMLKERRKLIIVPREMPYSLIHIENIKTITLSGGIICPASPNFYSNPKTIEELATTVVDRVLDLANVENKTFRWNQK